MGEALIIAAGYGSRLAGQSPCKPLTPVAGVPMIELGIRQAAAAGVRRVVVVTGHQAERLEAFLDDLARRLGLPIVAERLTDWSRPNGWSVLAGAARIDGDYLLLMADHLFALPILERLRGAAAPDRGVTLAIDRRLGNPLVDPIDATRVRIGEGGRIALIGKGLAAANAIDCGAFLATPELAAALRSVIGAGAAGHLSDGIQHLAAAGRAATLSIEDAWWLDIDDPRAHALAEAQAPRQLALLYAEALTDISS